MGLLAEAACKTPQNSKMSWAALVKSSPAPDEGASSETPQQTQQQQTQPAAAGPKRQAVVDSNAIMKGLRLESVAERLVTVPEVFSEVRDKQSRAFLASLPFGIDVQEPSEESLKAGTRVLVSGVLISLHVSPWLVPDSTCSDCFCSCHWRYPRSVSD